MYIKEKLLFIVTGNCQPPHVEHAMRQQPHRNVKFFIDVSGSDIATNSTAVMSALKAEGALESVGLDGEGFPKGKVAEGTEARAVEGAVNRGIRIQQDIDAKLLFICEVTCPTVADEDVETAMESASECHEAGAQVDQEVGWDDVNSCQLDPARVCEARAAEMEHFRKMKVYKKVSTQRCKDLTGQMSIKVR